MNKIISFLRFICFLRICHVLKVKLTRLSFSKLLALTFVIVLLNLFKNCQNVSLKSGCYQDLVLMLSLLSEVHFWTLRDDICVPYSDFGAFKYHDKKSNDDSPLFEGKKSYAERRGHVWVPQNKRPIRLKDNLKELEEHLSHQRVVMCEWRHNGLLQLMFGSGLFVNIEVNIFSGDLVSITYDKFFVGKLLSEYISDVVITKSHLICSYNDGQLTLVYFMKPTLKRSVLKSFSRLEPRMNTIDLAGPSGRRLERKLASNVSGDMIVVWWHSSHDEVYPWSPVVKDQDRANILVYGISGMKTDLLCHHRSEFDLLSISFSRVHSNVVRAVEQKVSQNGDVTVESSSYQVSKGSMNRTSVASISLPTHVCCHSFSPLQDKLLLGCIDGSVVLFDEALGVTRSIKAPFIPSIVSWHPDGGIFAIANERCQLQLLDASLATLKQQLLSEDISSGHLLDITSYFRIQPTLRSLKWNKKAETSFYSEKFSAADCLLLLLFERGPLSALRFVGGGGLLGDIHGVGGLTYDSLVAQYLWVNEIDRAIYLLQTLNWDISGNTCLSCLQRIVNHLFKLPVTPDHEAQIQKALGCFHMPVRPMCLATIDEFKAPVRDLTRRFFHHLLRYQLFEKAFRLAIDLMDRDLFMDIFFSAKRSGKSEVADAAFKKAEEIDSNSYTSSTSVSSHSKCSRSSCSDCSESTSRVSDSEDQEHFVDYTSCLDLTKSQESRGIEIEEQSGPILAPLNFHRLLPVQNKDSRNALPECLDRLWPQDTTFAGNMQNADSFWEKLSVKDNFKNYPKENAQNDNASVLTFLPALQALEMRNERPKVKFCETVTQITLPDRLHTVTEEEEDILSNPPATLNCANASNSVLTPQNASSALENPVHLSSPSFPHSANDIGIPIMPLTTRSCFPQRRNVNVDEPCTPCYVIPNLPSWMNSTVLNSKIFASTQNSHALKEQPIMSSIGSNLHQSTSKDNQNIESSDNSNNSFAELKRHEEGKKRNELDFNDLLGTEELSALLPGSRKPLTSTNITYENSFPSRSISSASQYINSLPSPNTINNSNASNDLSEEEENNSSIKIVHFGVV